MRTAGSSRNSATRRGVASARLRGGSSGLAVDLVLRQNLASTDHVEKCQPDCGIELRPKVSCDFLPGLCHRERAAIWTLRRHCIECVGESHNSRADRNVFSRQAIWIACSVPSLMVIADDDRNIAQLRNGAQDALADQRMRAVSY